MKREKQKVCRVLSILVAIVVFLGIGFKYNEQVQSASYYPYLIKVNRQACTITIYGKDKSGNYTVPVKAMLCSPGVGDLTPLGTYKTPAKYRWKLLMNNVWGQYSTRIVGGILFHSVWYYDQDPATMSNREYNKLGTKCSHGCVRITTEDAKWIYDNCPIGTTVQIYDSSDPGPLGKPEGIKVSTATKKGYDPTDIWSSNNPYLKKTTVINGTSNKTIEYGSTVNVTSGVTVTSSTNVDITSKLKVNITYNGKTVKTVDTKKVGSYSITYSATDLLGKKAEKKVVYKVVDTAKPEILGVKEIYTNKKPDTELALENVVVKWHGKEVNKDDVKVTLKTVSNEEGLRTYKVTYSYKASNGKSTKVSTTIYRDKEAPVLLGVEDGLVALKKDLTKTNLVANVSVSDNLDKLTTNNIKITKEKLESGYYKILYTVSDKAGNTTTEEALYRVKNGLVIMGVEDKVITKDQVMDAEFVKAGIKAYNCGVDITSEMEYEITSSINEYNHKEYTVIYRIFDESGKSAKKKAVFIVDTPIEEVPEDEIVKDETQNDTVTDETVEDTTENNTPIDETAEDTTENNTPTDETVEDTTENDTSIDGTVEDATENNTSIDGTVEGETQNDISTAGEVEQVAPVDETNNNEVEQNEIINDTVENETQVEN